ncbi:MAG TPA: trypsin-like peptidase domain-containing protein [Sphingobacteriaceae bacterium]|nr:trypsin-like peptidase domain-containing protein [Sphingobacteriaceae bacterium]
MDDHFTPGQSPYEPSEHGSHGQPPHGRPAHGAPAYGQPSPGQSPHGGGPSGPRWTVKRNSRPFWNFLLAALVGGIIGALVTMSFAGQLLPGGSTPPLGAGNDRLPLNGLSGNNEPPLPGSDQGPHGNDGADSSPVVEVVDKVGPAVVGILNKRMVRDISSGESFPRIAATGSGVIFSPDGYIITNYHVIEGADQVEVVVADGRVLPATIVAHDDPFSDLAVLRIEATDLPYAVFGDSDQVRVGETVVAIGNPQGLDFFRSVTVGVVSGIRPDLLHRLSSGRSDYARIFELIQTDAAINRGNSGGPLVNLRGEVIGINTLKFQGADIEGMGFAIPSNDVRLIANDLVQYGRVIRPALGVSLIPDDIAASRYGVTAGVIVAETIPGGPAQRVGIRSGDVILRINDQETERYLDLLKALNKMSVGDTVQVLVDREGSTLTFEVELGELQINLR